MTKSSRLFRSGLAVLVLLIGASALSTIASAAPQTVEWSGAENRSNSGDKSVYPSVAYDAQGFVHLIWLEYSGSSTSRVWYTNNINGSFSSPFEVATNGGTNNEHITALTVETNRVHVFYISNNTQLRHVILTLNGATPSRGETITLSSGKAFAPSTVVDSSGRVHVAWADNRSGQYQVYHRIWNGGWDGTRGIRLNGEYQKAPSLVATNDGRVHALFSIQNQNIAYSVFDGSWRNGNSPATEYGNLSALATDGTSVFAIWSTKIHRVQYAELSNGNWNNRAQISNGNTWSDYPTIAYSRGNGKVYTFWSAPESPNSKVVVREVVPGSGDFSDIVTLSKGTPSNWPRAAASANNIMVAWQDKSPSYRGGEEVFSSVAVAKQPLPPVPSGSLLLSDPSVQPGQNGELYTNQPTVNARIRQTGGGQANEYGLSNSGDPGNPAQSFNGSEQTVQFPLSVNTNSSSCQTGQINGRLEGAGGIGNIFSDSITYDPSVNAVVAARNPNLRGGGTTSGDQARVPGAPINFGDPRYTNSTYFALTVSNGPNECSGLNSYTLTYTGAPNGVSLPTAESKPLPTGGSTTGVLPGSIQGEYTFRVSAADNAGNTGNAVTSNNNISLSMIYDNEAPVVTPPQGNIAPATETADGVLQLDLSGITVSDRYTVNGSNRNYYGVWIVVRKAGELPSDSDWQSRGIGVVGDATNLKWNMAMGLADAFVPGEQYQMYIRFVDGATNVSEQTLVTAPITIDALEGPRAFLPLVQTR